MSATCRCRSSAFRMPVEYSTISIVRCDKFCAALIKCVTSSTLRIVGSRRGALGYGVSSSEYRRFNVFTKKKRIAQTCNFTVRGASFRSRRRCA